MKRLIFGALGLLSLSFAAVAQNITPRDNVLWDMNYYNPAVVMRGHGIYADFYARYDMNELKSTMTNPLDIAAETYVVRDDHTWQASLQHDGSSYFDAAMFNVSYAHHFVFGDEKQHAIKAGGRVALGYGRIDFSKLEYDQDGYKMTFRPDIDLGIEYRYKFFHIGLSIKNALSIPVKDDGAVYFRYPRAGYGYFLFDANIKDVVMLNPYFMVGMAQNIFLDTGLNVSVLNRYHFVYAFHGPDLGHNVGVAIDIAKRVCLEAGYHFAPAHNTSAITMRLSVRLCN